MIPTIHYLSYSPSHCSKSVRQGVRASGCILRARSVWRACKKRLRTMCRAYADMMRSLCGQGAQALGTGCEAPILSQP